VLIATPNLCLDRTEFLSALVPGSVLRSASVEVTAGGKGVNVARVARAYGQRPAIVGFIAADDGDQLLGLLRGEGADVVPVATTGRVRQAIVMIEQDAGRITIVNEPGNPVGADDWARYLDAIGPLLAGQDVLVCAGSLPPGAPADGYGQLVRLAREAGVRTIVDTAPGPLRAALASGPDLVTPNLEEAEAAVGGHPGDVLTAGGTEVPARALQAAQELRELGAVRAAVTAGAAGVGFVDEHGTTSWVPAVPVHVVSPVGAGDSFVAGLALGLFADPTSLADPTSRWRAALVRATATASASCEQVRAGGVDPARVTQLIGLMAAETAR
jgi:1-phosphofructokinase family hexose kinase